MFSSKSDVVVGVDFRMLLLIIYQYYFCMSILVLYEEHGNLA